MTDTFKCHVCGCAVYDPWYLDAGVICIKCFEDREEPAFSAVKLAPCAKCGEDCTEAAENDWAVCSTCDRETLRIGVCCKCGDGVEYTGEHIPDIVCARHEPPDFDEQNPAEDTEDTEELIIATPPEYAVAALMELRYLEQDQEHSEGCLCQRHMELRSLVIGLLDMVHRYNPFQGVVRASSFTDKKWVFVCKHGCDTRDVCRICAAGD